MGKASRRRTDRSARSERVAPAPFERRPFEGLTRETEWVALRDLLPSATLRVTARAGTLPEGAPDTVTFATVLPLTWPALHRGDDAILVATQVSPASGDASRDLASAWLAAADLPPGTPLTQVPMPTATTPRLQDLIDPAATLEMTLHEDFAFWVGDAQLDEEGQASLEQANASIVPTHRVPGDESVFWVDFGQRRTYIRWVVGADEDTATNALARLVAADRARLTPDSRLLGAFRSCGLLVPVWEVDPDADPETFGSAVEALHGPLQEALAATTALTDEQRRARNGLLSRQVTLR